MVHRRYKISIVTYEGKYCFQYKGEICWQIQWDTREDAQESLLSLMEICNGDRDRVWEKLQNRVDSLQRQFDSYWGY